MRNDLALLRALINWEEASPNTLTEEEMRKVKSLHDRLNLNYYARLGKDQRLFAIGLIEKFGIKIAPSKRGAKSHAPVSVIDKGTPDILRRIPLGPPGSGKGWKCL